jgi:CheY-like chemotaxis protein
MALPCRLLLAEDDPVSRSFLHEALSSAGHAVTSVADGGEALARATAQAFDLLLLDLHLPSLDGPQLLARLRDTPAALSRRAPALALTAENDPRVHAELADSGFVTVLCKPLGVDVLLRAVAAIRAAGDARADDDTPIAAADRPAAGDAAPAALGDEPVWDDRIALRATRGNPDIVDSLRRLMLQELPAQRTRTLDAVARRDLTAARAELHRLRAACGFCGARELAQAVDELTSALDAGDGALQAAGDAFEQASRKVLAADPARLERS